MKIEKIRQRLNKKLDSLSENELSDEQQALIIKFRAEKDVHLNECRDKMQIIATETKEILNKKVSDLLFGMPLSILDK